MRGYPPIGPADLLVAEGAPVSLDLFETTQILREPDLFWVASMTVQTQSLHSAKRDMAILLWFLSFYKDEQSTIVIPSLRCDLSRILRCTMITIIIGKENEMSEVKRERHFS